MRYTLFVERYAQKQIMKLNKDEIPFIKEAIASLANNPRRPGCKKLKGEPAWRIRVGNYRRLCRFKSCFCSQRAAFHLWLAKGFHIL